MLDKVKNLWRNVWPMVRQLSGDDAYERYLAHYTEFHTEPAAEQPLSREEFFKQWQDGKWKGIKRCC